ncbi:MAG: type IV pilus assembly protein PilM [bacterium]
MDFLTLKPEAFGLDISDLSLKIVKLKKRGSSLSLASFGEAPIRPGVIKAGEVKDEKALTAIIKKSLTGIKGENLKTKYVVASLPEEKSYLQVIQMPRLAKEDLKSAVIYEAENHIPLPIEQVYLDSQVIAPVKNHLDHFDVLIAALPRSIVDSYYSCLIGAGLKPIVLEIESLAIARALTKDKLGLHPLALIDLGATRTSLMVFSGRSLRFTSSILVSSRKFTESISRTLNVDLAKAEKLKLKYGLTSDKNKEAKEVFFALIPAVIDLTEQIKKYIDYYQSHASHEHLSSNGKGIKKIFLCGGGANLIKLTDFFSEKLGIPVEVGNPWVNILPEPQKELPDLPFKKSLSYATALGLALRGISD